jgi:membrane associated rhomboid family serine protease
MGRSHGQEAAMSELTLEEGLAFRQKLARRSKLRLKLQISAGALLAIVSAGHVISGVLDGDVAAKSLSVFGLMVGLYVAAHYSVLLIAKRALWA